MVLGGPGGCVCAIAAPDPATTAPLPISFRSERRDNASSVTRLCCVTGASLCGRTATIRRCTQRKAGTRGTLASDLHASKTTTPRHARDRGGERADSAMSHEATCDRAMLRCDADSSRCSTTTPYGCTATDAPRCSAPRIVRCSNGSLAVEAAQAGPEMIGSRPRQRPGLRPWRSRSRAPKPRQTRRASPLPASSPWPGGRSSPSPARGR